jgi:hypothetical protein
MKAHLGPVNRRYFLGYALPIPANHEFGDYGGILATAVIVVVIVVIIIASYLV